MFLKNIIMLFFFLSFCFAQEFTIYPYLQNSSPNSIVIMWESSMYGNSVVEWGETELLGNVNSSTYEITYYPACLFTAEISNLKANTRYYYRVKNNNINTSVYSFITPSLPNDEASTTLVAMSDMQKDYNNPEKFKEINNAIINYFQDDSSSLFNKNLDLVLIPGDLVKTGNNYDHWKDHFFYQSRQLFSHVPFYPVLGNHEENSNFYFQYINLPFNGTKGFEEHWWYKDYSNVRIIGLNSNSEYQIEDQINWLDSILELTIYNNNIDFLFAQLHHPHNSELWTPGNTNFTGEIISLLEDFTSRSGKPSIHFYGHTHGYSRGESKNHQHLMVNVASAGGAIDYWDEWPQNDYDEYSISQDEWGYVVVDVNAGDNPSFILKRLSLGDESNSKFNSLEDSIVVRLYNTSPDTPTCIYPSSDDSVDVNNLFFKSSHFNDLEDEHGGTQWQISHNCLDFSDPIIDKWIQSQNIYRDINLNSNINLINHKLIGLQANSNYCWRVRYRDKGLKWSQWSNPMSFNTNNKSLLINVIPNPINDKSLVTIPYLDNSIIKIYNIEGKVVQEIPNQNKSLFILNKSNFDSGVYILKLFQRGQCITQTKFTVL
ncbi:MAG: metallophosphoesterase [Flavobacteriales bacterium]|nr:metallophosphoesterase [Flavobacteriales bacterium]